MLAALIHQTSIDSAAEEALREQLAAARARLIEQEADLTQLRSRLAAFEDRYFRQVGVLYAQLDDLEARIAEREVDLYQSDEARNRAATARQRADDTEAASQRQDADAEPFDPPPSLKKLFREVAKRIHPDTARDSAEASHFTRLMALANGAYRRGDAEALERFLSDHLDAANIFAANDAAAEMERTARHLRHAERDLAALKAERDVLLEGEIAQLADSAEAAADEHRDLLAELAADVRVQIADAEYRLQFIDRQVTAHGR